MNDELINTISNVVLTFVLMTVIPWAVKVVRDLATTKAKLHATLQSHRELKTQYRRLALRVRTLEKRLDDGGEAKGRT